MNDAFDDLECQLRRGARSLGTLRSLRPRRRHRRTLALAIAVVLVLSAGALAATRIVNGGSAETQGRDIAWQAVRDTANQPACTMVNVSSAGRALTDAAPLKEITDLLPALKTPSSSGDHARALALVSRFPVGSGGAALTQTLRTISLPGGIRLLVYVQQGIGFGAVHDPVGCGRLRLARAQLLSRERSVAVQRWARWRLAQMRDTVPGLQTLWVSSWTAHKTGGGGGGDPVLPGHPLHPGLSSVRGERDGSRVFVGIAGRRAVRVLVKTPPATMRGYPTQVPVVQGFYAVVIPKGVGPFRLLEVAADGAALHSVNLRQ
jgi:hypothetical protein